jgi:hypothetical protein
MRSTIWGVILAVVLGIVAGVVIGKGGGDKKDVSLNAAATTTSALDETTSTSGLPELTIPPEDPNALPSTFADIPASAGKSVHRAVNRSTGGGGGGRGGGGGGGGTKTTTKTTVKTTTTGSPGTTNTTAAPGTTTTAKPGTTTTAVPPQRFCGPGPTTSIPSRNYEQICHKPAPTTTTSSPPTSSA